MSKQERFYLIKVQYLGFRYHGWAIQPGVKTVQGMIEKTLTYILGDKPFKVLGAGRTDAMVSAEGAYFELFINQKIEEDDFLFTFNSNLPQDIRALSISEVNSNFNIIQSVSQKKYRYHFAFGEKANPFSSPFMTFVLENLNIDAIIEAAPLFEGQHDYIQYCYKPGENVDTNRSISLCRIKQKKNDFPDFFPQHSYALHVHGKGFMRKQIRLIAGALILLGKGEITSDQIESSIEGNLAFEQYIAPASGLVLEDVTFNV